MHVQEVEFPSEGATLTASLYTPAGQSGPLPIVIMAHGISATTRMVADKYAEVFCRNGLMVLLYDHRNFGRSGGTPRAEINQFVQCRGYRSGMDFAQTLKGVDKNRMAIWGDSISAGQVMAVAAVDPRVRAVVSQIPACGKVAPAAEPSEKNFLALKEFLLNGNVAGTSSPPMPVVSADQLSSPSILKPIQAFKWFIDYGGRAGSRWNNQVTMVTAPSPVPYSPVNFAPFIKPPILVMVAPDDEIEQANPEITRHAFNLMPEPKELYDIQGGHFGLLYEPSEIFSEASSKQAEFLRKWLLT